MGLTVLMVEVFIGKKAPQADYFITQITLGFVLILTVQQIGQDRVILFEGAFVRDTLGDILKIFIYLTTMLSIGYSRRYLKEREMLRGEFYVMVLFAVFGIQVLVSAGSLLTVYMGLETMSLSIYALIAWRRDDLLATEAAMKYFVLGSLASGILLYGMSMIYGVTGNLGIYEIAQVVRNTSEHSLIFNFGLVFLVVGVAFKLGVVPFHMWMPDVYHGSPTALTIFLATASKLAAFAMLIRLWVDALAPVLEELKVMIVILSALSLIVGNVVAIAQTNLKRMLAYSAISHMGFVLMGIASGEIAGYANAMYYVIVYALTSAAGFGVILFLSTKDNESDKLEDLKGLAKRSPFVALVLLIIMFSMAGIPPTVGFYAKLSVLRSAVHADITWLALLGVVMSVVGAFYYLRVVKLVYFDEPQTKHPTPDSSIAFKTVLGVNAIALIALGIAPDSLIALCVSAF